jgi:hypothetical protein
LAIPDREPDPTGLHSLFFFNASVTEIELWLDEAHLAAAWSEFTNCHFRQRVRPVTHEQGISAQGSFANRPTLYRNCVFEGVRFKRLGGFNLSRGWYEDCTFLNCRWEGHFAHDASLVNCTFLGRMNGCGWFGESDRGANVVRGNDFTEVQFTDNVGWRRSFPLAQQHWPPGFQPLVDD